MQTKRDDDPRLQRSLLERLPICEDLSIQVTPDNELSQDYINEIVGVFNTANFAAEIAAGTFTLADDDVFDPKSEVIQILTGVRTYSEYLEEVMLPRVREMLGEDAPSDLTAADFVSEINKADIKKLDMLAAYLQRSGRAAQEGTEIDVRKVAVVLEAIENVLRGRKPGTAEWKKFPVGEELKIVFGEI